MLQVKGFIDEHDLDMEVSYVMHQHMGEDNAIGRWELVAAVYGPAAAVDRSGNNKYDRNVRDSIERHRERGLRFCSKGNGAGYYVAKTRDEYEIFKEYYLSSVYRRLKIVQAMDDGADGQWGKVAKPAPKLQPSLFGG